MPLSSSSSSSSTTHHQPMKRIRRLPPEKRQKVSTACDGCKKRKFKCNGSNPCDSCSKKGFECKYTVIDKRSLKSERLFRLREQKRIQEEMEAQRRLDQEQQPGSESGPNIPIVAVQEPNFPSQQQHYQQYPQQQALQSFPPPDIASRSNYVAQPYPNQQITPPDAPPYQSPRQPAQVYQQQGLSHPPLPLPPPSHSTQYQPPPPHQLQQAPQNYPTGTQLPPPQPQPHYPYHPPQQRLPYPNSPRNPQHPYQQQPVASPESKPGFQNGPPPYNQPPYYGLGPNGHPNHQGTLLPPARGTSQRGSHSPSVPQTRFNEPHYQYSAPPQVSQYHQTHYPPPFSKGELPDGKHPHTAASLRESDHQPITRTASILTPDSPESHTSEKTRANSVPKFLQPLLSFPTSVTEVGDANGDERIKEDKDTIQAASAKRSQKHKHSATSKLKNQVESNTMIDEEIANEMAREVDFSDSKDGVSNQAGKSCILLNDKSGTFRYMGETSPLSVLYETRNIFYQYVGKTKLTEDLRGCPVIDKPNKVTAEVVVQLPPTEERNIYIQQFKRNINDTFFVYDLDKFYNEIVEPVYLDPTDAENQTKLVQLYFVLAIGATYYSFSRKDPQAELGARYFESGLLVLRSLSEDSEIWCVLVEYLQFHYYQSILKKSTGWIHLNLAIKYAQSLGLHRNFINEQFSNLTDECEYRKRIFRSLYSSDRISSVFIGRPLSINDYDWDDPTRYKSSKTLISSGLNFNGKCQIELTRICNLIGKIVANFYQNRIIDIDRTKNLAVQLKSWSKNLDPLLSVESLLKPQDIPHNGDGGNTQVILMMHLLQLFAIMLLCRPFFMYDAVSQVNSAFPKTLKDTSSSKQFIKAAAKAAIMTVKVMNHYINTTFKEVKRMECYVIITCCFYSSIFIGISILNGSNFSDEEGGEEEESYTETELMNLLRNAVFILKHYSKCNKGAERYAEIGIDLIGALENRHKSTKESTTESSTNVMNEPLSAADELFNYFNFTDDANAQDLQNLIDFQQFFVSSDITNSSISSSSNMPYDYGNYDLFFGDKY
ncbi:hypothetical protein I9W82_004048 [Candida metapsilosis]|uniref:Zn(2)-C6 fungal-type domain-containing protein n=1 Tax=Candida metapsilosis TaxID=273372 RepID=A0A8H8DB44_9ASCO|nr:hypothetical protein I9W82_004048 [Candida metapsilosis]